MTDTELLALADTVRDFVEEQVRTSCAPLVTEIESLRAQIRDFNRARDISDEALRSQISELSAVRASASEMPEPPAVDMVAVTSIIQREVRAAVDELPPAKDGMDGKDGRDGIDGKDGARGMDGANGKDGADGIAGRDGKDGINGRDGESLKGDPGIAGINGKDGRDGIDGKEGVNGRDGAPGERGMDGISGKDGAPGERGNDGQPGRDATQIEILPAIDVTKSYPRGTHAIHDGGLMRSFRTTEPLTDDAAQCGWEVMVNGLAGFSVSQSEDLRTFHVEMRLTGGKTIVRSFAVPVVLDRGVFKDGTDYQRGDSVSWDGSGWICQVESTKAKPGTTADWRLSTKRGRDGKDLRTPEDKPNSGPVKLK